MIKNNFYIVQQIFYLFFCFLIFNVYNQAYSKTLIEGEQIAGGVLFCKSFAGAAIYLDGKKIPVSKNGSFIVGFHRDPKSIQTIKILGGNSYEEEIILKIENRKYKIQRIDGIEPSKVNPPEEVLERIYKEIKLIKKARNSSESILEPYYEEGFVSPAEGPISGVYGSQRILNGEVKRPHYGIDIALPVGHPVLAAGTGKILLAEEDLYFSGGTLIIGHGQGLTTSYLHMSKILVEVGDVVIKGSLIGEVGATGRTTGSHLDWRAEWMNRRVDPSFLLNFN